MSTPTVADQVKSELAKERAAEENRLRERQRVKGLDPRDYFQEAARAQDARFRARIERMYAEAEARTAAHERLRPERERLEAQIAVIAAAQRDRMSLFDRERAEAMAGFAEQRRPIEAALAAIVQEVEFEAKSAQAVAKRGIFGRKRGAR